jgi:hypothetical protein
MNKQSSNKQSSDKQSSDKQSSNKQSSDKQSSDKQSSNKQSSKNYIEYNKFYKNNFLSVDTEYTKLVEYFKNFNVLPNSYERRLVYTYLAYYVNFDTVNTITSIFKAKLLNQNNNITSFDIIFGFGFYDIQMNSKFNNIISKNRDLSKNIIPKFIMINGGYDSKDGEYRSGLITYQSLYLLQSPVLEKYRLNELLMDIKIYIKERLHERKICLYEDFFYPNEKIQMSVNYTNSHDNIDSIYIYFACAWFKFFNDKKLNIIPNHLNKIYIDLFTKNKKHEQEDDIFFNKLCKKYSEKTFVIFRYLLNNFLNYYIDKADSIDNILHYNIKYGQKLIPLSVSEATHPFSLLKKPWREYLISLNLSDYVLNNVTPGFAITNTWFYVKNTRKGLFDNDIQYDKLERSEIAEQISILLRRAHQYSSDNEYNKYTKSNKNFIKSVVSNKFKTLSEKINDPIMYVNDEILMSNVALNIISEYVGRTFFDMVTLSQSSIYYKKLLGNPFENFQTHYFQKYIFEICYNLLCLNQKAGIIHGDLHLNNVTGKPYKYNTKLGKCNVLYIIDSDNYYVMPNNTYTICIIDFSRSIITPEKINLYKDSSLPNSFNIYNNLEKIQKDQVERLIYIYNNYANNSTNIDELRFIFSTKFKAVFKLLTVVDIYGFTEKLIKLFSIYNNKINKNCITLLNNINNDCKIFLFEYMNKLILNNDFSDTILKMDYPLKTIIRKNFSIFLLSKNSDITVDINDIFNINNPLKYSTNILEKFAPFMIKGATEKTLFKCKNLRNDYEKQKKKNMTIVNLIANRQSFKNII